MISTRSIRAENQFTRPAKRKTLYAVYCFGIVLAIIQCILLTKSQSNIMNEIQRPNGKSGFEKNKTATTSKKKKEKKTNATIKINEERNNINIYFITKIFADCRQKKIVTCVISCQYLKMHVLRNRLQLKS